MNKRLDQYYSAFPGVIENNKGIIYKIANSYCRDSEDRKDLVQEIIIQLWLAYPKYDDRFQLSTWIYRIALNTSISFYRKENRRKDISKPLSTDIFQISEDVNEKGETSENLKRLQQFIGELKALDKALVLLYLEDKTHKEIAEILGLSLTNVATKIARVKEKLRQKFSNSS